MLKKLFAAFLFTGTFGFFPHSRPALPDASRISEALSTFYLKHPQENVFLMTDREVYAPGDTVWFRGYLTCLGKPSPISKVVYVEVIDSFGLIGYRATLPVDQGAAEGDFVLPADLPAGQYGIRSYTSWMLNFDPALFFRKDLLVGTAHSGGTKESGEGAAAPVDSPGDYRMEFFPEGGSLVEGLTSKIAFRALGPDGRPVAVEGRIVDSSGKAGKSFSVLHDGMGSFAVHESAGNSYRAMVDFPGGIHRSYPLPLPKPAGIVLYINSLPAENGDDSVCFRVSRSGKDKDRYQHLVICAQMEGKVEFTYIDFDESTAGNYNNTVLTAPSPLSLDEFHEGLLHLSVFNGAGEVLAQRLVFLHRKRVSPVLTLDTAGFSPHGRNVFRLDVPGDYKGNYAVSVTRAGMDGFQQVGADDSRQPTTDLVSQLRLATDISARVADWRWYCRDEQPETTEALDLLLLTAKWTRFDWQKILNDQYPPIRYYAEPSLVVKGQAFWGTGKSKRPMKGGEFSLMIKAPRDSLFAILRVPVDEDGHFSLTDLNFHDTATLYVQNNNTKKDKEISVVFDRNPLDSIRYAPVAGSGDPGNASGALAAGAGKGGRQRQGAGASDPVKRGALAGFNRDPAKTADSGKLLKTVTVYAHQRKREDSLLDNYATGIFASRGASGRIMDFTEDKVSVGLYGISVVEYLVSKVPGLIYTVSGGEYIISWRASNGFFVPGSPVQRAKMNAPAFFLNEQLLNTNNEGYDDAMSTLQDVKMADVAMVRIFEPGTMPLVSGDAPHGAIAIYLRNGSEYKLEHLRNNFNRIHRSGYTVTQKFQAPEYGSRKTLYWNPALETDAVTHRVQFSFYNDDTGGPFHVVIQGIDSTGAALRIDTVFGK